MEITFYGVRGTVAVPGPETNEFGGNTACIHIKTKKGHDLILDAGTGICGLSRKLLATPLGKGQGEVSIFLSHTHLDHIQGFPFFIPAFIPGNKIRIYGEQSSSVELRKIMDGQLHSTFSPICALSNFSATIEITELTSPVLDLDGVTITHCKVPHGAIGSTAYRIEEEGKALVYMTDVEHDQGFFHDDILNLVRNAQILVHDSHYSSEDGEAYAGSGHSSMELAIELAKAGGVHKLVLFHYSPEYSDDMIRSMVHRNNGRTDTTVIPSQEGLKLIL